MPGSWTYTQQATDDLIGRIESQEVKEELKRTTQEALDLGVWLLWPCFMTVTIFLLLQAFGAPFIVAHIGDKKEEFFGSDRMELLAHTLGEKWEGPLVELTQGSFLIALSEGHISINHDQ